MKIDFWNNGDLEEKLIEIGKFERIASMLKKAKTTIQQHQWHTQLVELLGENVAECLRKIAEMDPTETIDRCFSEIYSRVDEIRTEYNVNKGRIIRIVLESMNDEMANLGIQNKCNMLARYFIGVDELMHSNGCDKRTAYARQFITKENGTYIVDAAKLAEKMNDIAYAAVVYMNFRIMSD